MKHLLFSLLMIVVISTLSAHSQKPVAKVHYEAANWETPLLENREAITLAAPPSVKSNEELRTIKLAIRSADAQTKEAIRYWNAGAPAYRWNQIAPKLVSWDKPDVVLRTPSAWMNLAIYNATVLAWKEKAKHKRKRPNLVDPSIQPIIQAPATYSYPCEHTVTAAAAATVLAYFYPQKGDSILKLARAAAQSRVDAGVQFPSDLDSGWKLGEAVAHQIIEKAKMDGSATAWDGKMNKDPQKWTGNYPLGITLASFKPMILMSPDQFRPAAPPDFKNEMEELKNFKQTSKTTYLAHYWANTGDTWTELTGQKLFEYRMMEDAPTVARVYAVLSAGYHDAAIAIMDAKYAYWGIRPAQYDTTFKPLIYTPPFPRLSVRPCCRCRYFFCHPNLLFSGRCQTVSATGPRLCRFEVLCWYPF